MLPQQHFVLVRLNQNLNALNVVRDFIEACTQHLSHRIGKTCSDWGNEVLGNLVKLIRFQLLEFVKRCNWSFAILFSPVEFNVEFAKHFAKVIEMDFQYLNTEAIEQRTRRF